MKRILVIGTSGSGKSSLAGQLAKQLKLPFIATDHFYWEPGWKASSAEKVRQRVGAVVSQEAWVLDGNFDDERGLVWNQANCIIWLDYSLTTILWQVACRNLRWVMTREPTWSGNRMTMQRAISGIRHAAKSYALKRRDYPVWLAERCDVTVYRFQTGRETQAWLQSLKQQVE